MRAVYKEIVYLIQKLPGHITLFFFSTFTTSAPDLYLRARKSSCALFDINQCNQPVLFFFSKHLQSA